MAPVTENQGSFLGRISIRRNQVVSMDVNNERQLEDVEIFQRQVSDRLAGLLPSAAEYGGATSTTVTHKEAPESETILSIPWLQKLLDVFLCCEAEFKAVLMTARDSSQISKPPLDRLVTEMMERSVKALDICNAVVNGINGVKDIQRLADIAVSTLQKRPLTDGNINRAKRALTNLVIALNVDEKKSLGGCRKNPERSWSFSRSDSGGATTKGGGSGGKNWSAARQIQAMWANLGTTRGTEASGLPFLVHTMSIATGFIMWVLVAAVPCEGRNGLPTNPPLPKQFGWTGAAVHIQEKIGEEMKKREKKGLGMGLMDEVQKMERLVPALMEVAEGFKFQKDEVAMAETVAEMAEVCRRMEAGLVPLQRQVREVFHRIVKSRGEILDVLEHS